MKYIILNAKSQGELEELIRSAIKEGYRPQGGVAIHSGMSHYLFQAMVKDKE